MARTKAPNYDDKRSSITRHAANLIAEKGFGGTSISNIAQACSVSKALIYHYYDAKEDILFGVMNDHIDDLIETLNDEALLSSDAPDEFLALTRSLIVKYRGAENAQKVLLYELKNLRPAQRREIVAKQRQIITRFEDTYLRIFPELKNNTKLLRTKIMLFFGMLNWLHTWHDPQGEIDREQLAGIISQTILGSPNEIT